MPLKMEDVDHVVEIASSLHQLYSEFSETFITTIVKSCASQNKDTDKKELNIARLSVVLLIITKLFTLRMHDNFSTIYNVLKGLVSVEKRVFRFNTSIDGNESQVITIWNFHDLPNRVPT